MTIHTVFRNRIQAGQLLGEEVRKRFEQKNQLPADILVLGLPRGGVPVAFEVAAALKSQLDVFVVRKLGAPGQEELAMGAIASGGTIVLNHDVMLNCHISQSEFQQAIMQEEKELKRRESLYRNGREPLVISKKTIVLVDDGLATGATMKAAIAAIRQLDPKQIMVAVPVAARSTYDKIESLADDVICLETPDVFNSVGNWYKDFDQTTDEDVCRLLSDITLGDGSEK